MFRLVERSMSSLARHGWLVLLTATIGAGALSACGAGQNTASSVPVATAPAITTPPGQATYLRSCARCHGADRMGKGSDPAIDASRLATLGDQRLRLVISTGKGKMPAFTKLTTAQVDELVAYLQTS